MAKKNFVYVVVPHIEGGRLVSTVNAMVTNPDVVELTPKQDLHDLSLFRLGRDLLQHVDHGYFDRGRILLDGSMGPTRLPVVKIDAGPEERYLLVTNKKSKGFGEAGRIIVPVPRTLRHPLVDLVHGYEIRSDLFAGLHPAFYSDKGNAQRLGLI